MKKRRIPIPCKTARLIFYIEMPISLLFAIAFLISYLISFERDPIYANIYYQPLLEYLLYPLLLTVFSMLLAERLEHT